MRCFLGLDLPEALQGALEDLQEAIPVGRRVAPENLHLTLLFLGEQDDQTLGLLHDDLEALAAAPVPIGVQGLGTFGGRSPKVLFAAVQPDPSLTSLHDRLVRAARRAGISLPRERFRPHITLARFGREGLWPEAQARLDRFLSEAAGLRIAPEPVSSFALFPSTLHPDGPVYEELARYPLG